MHHTARTLRNLRLANTVFVLLLLVAVGLLQWVGREYHLRLDLTGNKRHSLSAASVTAVGLLKEPLRITAFASQRGELRQQIHGLIETYRRHKDDVKLEFVDPDSAPARVRAEDIRHDGDLVFEYRGVKEKLPLPELGEEGITNLLTRLGHREEQWIVFVTGHGERRPDRGASFDVSALGNQLQKRGFRIHLLSLAEGAQIPRNTAVLVIAGPRTRWLPREVRAVEDYVRNGGNLLWLADPGPLPGLERLAELLGVEFPPGAVIDPASVRSTRRQDVSAVVVNRYGQHPVVRNFDVNTLFMHVAAIRHRAPEGWQATVLLDTPDTAWLESGPLEGEIRFDPGEDARGPLDLAVALTRAHDKREQRVAVIGDGDFLSNGFLAQGGNFDLAMSLVNWLARNDAYVSIPTQTASDRQLNLTPAAITVIVAGFLFVLPIALATSGLAIWWRRRKR